MKEKSASDLPVPSMEDVALHQRLQALLCAPWSVTPAFVAVSAGVRPYPE